MSHRLGVLLLTLLLPACTGPGYRGTFQPRSAELTISGEDGAPLAELAVSVPGQWHGWSDDGEVRVLFRLHNVSQAPLELPVERCDVELWDGSHCGPPRRVGAADAPGATGAALVPGESAIIEVGFMPPSSDADLRHVIVRWVLLSEGHEVPGSAEFDRDEPTHARYGGIKVSAADRPLAPSG